MDKEVFIVGAGPVGLTLALVLTQLKIPCRIIDKLVEPTDQSRAAGIHARTLELLASMGVVDEIIQQGNQAHAISVCANSECIARIDYSKVKSPYPFAVLLPQAQTEKILTEHLASLNVSVERGVELIDFVQEKDAVSATLKHADAREEKITTGYLVGCDGAHSVVRHQLNFEFKGESLEQAWIFGDIDADWDGAQDEIHLIMREQGIFFCFSIWKWSLSIGCELPRTRSARG